MTLSQIFVILNDCLSDHFRDVIHGFRHRAIDLKKSPTGFICLMVANHDIKYN